MTPNCLLKSVNEQAINLLLFFLIDIIECKFLNQNWFQNHRNNQVWDGTSYHCQLLENNIFLKKEVLFNSKIHSV